MPSSTPRPGTAVLAALLLAVTLTADAATGAAPSLPPNLPAEIRTRLAPVTRQPSLATRVEGTPFVARLDVFEYLLDHPEFATHVTRTLRLARYRIWRTPAGLAIDDGWGTTGTFEVLYAVPGTRLLYARGTYDHAVLPDIHGQAVVVVDYAPRPTPEGRQAIATTITGFVKIDGTVMAMAGRLASRLARAKAEKEANRLVKVFARTTQRVESDPAGVCEQLRRRPDVPRAELEEFRRLLNVAGAR
ncbi:MAG TPA: hypothetical protein VFX28_23715 [Methylomirabilota bacterium]|nr:hypothetical protein [Methylomirabilota bacterium]